MFKRFFSQPSPRTAIPSSISSNGDNTTNTASSSIPKHVSAVLSSNSKVNEEITRLKKDIDSLSKKLDIAKAKLEKLNVIQPEISQLADRIREAYIASGANTPLTSEDEGILQRVSQVFQQNSSMDQPVKPHWYDSDSESSRTAYSTLSEEEQCLAGPSFSR